MISFTFASYAHRQGLSREKQQNPRKDRGLTSCRLRDSGARVQRQSIAREKATYCSCQVPLTIWKGKFWFRPSRTHLLYLIFGVPVISSTFTPSTVDPNPKIAPMIWAFPL